MNKAPPVCLPSSLACYSSPLPESREQVGRGFQQWQLRRKCPLLQIALSHLLGKYKAPNRHPLTPIHPSCPLLIGPHEHEQSVHSTSVCHEQGIVQTEVWGLFHPLA